MLNKLARYSSLSMISEGRSQVEFSGVIFICSNILEILLSFVLNVSESTAALNFKSYNIFKIGWSNGCRVRGEEKRNKKGD